MEITYDPKAGAIYISFTNGEIAETDEVREGVILDPTSEGKLLGLELLFASGHIPLADLAHVSIKMPLELAR